MQWRNLFLARACTAAGVLSCLLVGTRAMAEPEEPAPSSKAVTETVSVLDAKKAGDLNVEVRGNGQDRVRIALRNLSSKRLNVVMPPGLVASSVLGQARAGGGFQSMGLGSVTNRPGSFGEFRTAAKDSESGFRAIPVSAEPPSNAVAVPAGQTIELTMPSVCLNFGLPTPTYRDRFELVDVDDYTTDPRARKALRTLAALGTSHGVAQATMWRVCNNVPFEVMVSQAAKVLNLHEAALAARLVDAIDASPEGPVVEASYLTESRVFISVEGAGTLAGEAKRLGDGLDGLHILGLPVRLVDGRELPEVAGPALLLHVSLASSQVGETRGRITVSHARRGEGWVPLGKTSFSEGSTVSVLDGAGLAKAVDRAVAAAFVHVKVARRGVTSTTLKVENRLPFSLAGVMIKATGSSGAPAVPFEGLGVGPARVGTAAIQAPGGSVERVVLNGL